MNSSSYIADINRLQPMGWTVTDQVKSYKFEEVDPIYWHSLIRDNRQLVFYTGAVYIFAIFTLQRWMKDRPAYQLRMPLFYWNLGLGLFSIVGFVRSTPGFIVTLVNPGGFYNIMCNKVGDVPGAFWILMFVFSKYVELGDTIFIVLRKRPLVFLQWYHHICTLTVVWLLAPSVEPVSRIYAYLNYGVHSFMYNYFALRAIGVKVPTWVANIITTLQLTQMLMGLGVNVASVHYYQNGDGCIRNMESIRVFSVVYGSFILLFGNLFYESVIKNGRGMKESVKKKE